MNRKQFTFYESFASALARIKSKAARCDAYDAICNFALYGIEPDLDSIPDAAAIAFDLIRPTLEASKRKAESGRRGGNTEANSKQTASKPEANGKQTASEKENEKENEKEGEIEIENECYKARSRSRFVPPTLDEVAQYCAERHNNVDPQRFLDFYASKGWMIGKNRMRDWKAAVRTWEKRDDGKAQTSGFLGIVEEMRGGDTHDDAGDWADIGLPGDTVPAELPWPLE